MNAASNIRAGSHADPILFLYGKWQAAQTEVARLNAEAPQLPPGITELSIVNEDKLKKAIRKRDCLAEQIAEVQAHTVVGLCAKIKIAAVYIRENTHRDDFDIEHRLAISADADADRILALVAGG